PHHDTLSLHDALPILPKEQASKARERKAAKLRKKHGPNYNQELVWWAGWVILVSTTDPAEWSGKELVALYRARWETLAVLQAARSEEHTSELQSPDQL